MSSIPKVTIKIKGVDTSADQPKITEDNLYMMYLQAVHGDYRRQWIVIPPNTPSLDSGNSGGMFKMLSRVQMFAGNRSKWVHSLINETDFLNLEVSRHGNDDWTFIDPIVVKLEVDDYRKMWDGETSHKAIRAVDRALAPYGISIK